MKTLRNNLIKAFPAKSNKTMVRICTTMILIVMGVYLFPIFSWNDPIPILIWALVLTGTHAITFLLILSHIQAKSREHTRKMLKKLSLRHIKYESELKRNCYKDYRMQALKDEKTKNALSQCVSTLMNENASLKEYKLRIREIYLCSSNEDTRTYALACLNCNNAKEGLQLFDPIRYLRNANYARIIDINAVLLTESLQESKTEEYLNIFHTQKKLDELLKSGTTTNGTSSTVPTLERKPLPRLDKGDER